MFALARLPITTSLAMDTLPEELPRNIYRVRTHAYIYIGRELASRAKTNRAPMKDTFTTRDASPHRSFQFLGKFLASRLLFHMHTRRSYTPPHFNIYISAGTAGEISVKGPLILNMNTNLIWRDIFDSKIKRVPESDVSYQIQILSVSNKISCDTFYIIDALHNTLL